MNRQDLRDAYPFHNPRAARPCCLRHAPAPRPFPWSRIIRAALVALAVAAIVKGVF